MDFFKPLSNEEYKRFDVYFYIYYALYLLCLVTALLRQLFPSLRESHLIKLIFQINVVLFMPIIVILGTLVIALFNKFPRKLNVYIRYKIYIEEAEEWGMEIQGATETLLKFREDMKKSIVFYLKILAGFVLVILFYWYWFYKLEH